MDAEPDPVLVAMRAALPRNQKSLPPRSELEPNSPAPQLAGMIKAQGPNLTRDALMAWDLRLRGESIYDTSRKLALSITGAKALIKEAHDAIAEDLKANLELNRSLDLHRIDSLIKTFYPAALEGDTQAANMTLKCLERRAKLCGTEPESAPGRSHPENILIWIQQQLPSITKLVDSLPMELVPGPPQ